VKSILVSFLIEKRCRDPGFSNGVCPTLVDEGFDVSRLRGPVKMDVAYQDVVLLKPLNKYLF
jgi:hypothetical protein